MALYLLDTDICSYVIRNRPEAVRKCMNAVPLESQAISVVTYAELMFGVRRSSNAKVNRTVVGAFLRHVSMLDWDRDAADAYAEMRGELEAKGTADRQHGSAHRGTRAQLAGGACDQQRTPSRADIGIEDRELGKAVRANESNEKGRYAATQHHSAAGRDPGRYRPLEARETYRSPTAICFYLVVQRLLL